MVNALDPFSYESNVFAKRERCFSFGPVTAQTADEVGGLRTSTRLDRR